MRLICCFADPSPTAHSAIESTQQCSIRVFLYFDFHFLPASTFVSNRSTKQLWKFGMSGMNGCCGNLRMDPYCCPASNEINFYIFHASLALNLLYVAFRNDALIHSADSVITESFLLLSFRMKTAAKLMN
ncbi:hypothetical protein Tcan_01032, partial [Toxocara canis]